MSARCRACDAEIWWLENQTTGKKAPIDAEPDPKGNVVASLHDGLYRIASADERAEMGPRRQLHLNHFVTCPKAKDFR